MLRTVEQTVGHRRVALIDRMEIGITDLRRPVAVKAVVVLRLKSRDLRPSDILEAVDHIGREV